MVVALAALAYGSDSSRGSLAGRFTAGQQRASRLQQAIQADSKLIRGYEGRIGNLQARLTVIERSVEAQERLLNAVNIQLRAARERLRSLEAQYARWGLPARRCFAFPHSRQTRRGRRRHCAAGLVPG